MTLLNSDKNETPVTGQRGIFQIPSDCGNYYIGRTHHILEKRLRQHMKSIKKPQIRIIVWYLLY